MRFLKQLQSLSAIVSVALILSGCNSSSTKNSFQVISFPPPSSQVIVGGTVTLSATATSSLPVSYASNSTSVCTVSGSTLTALTSGTCSVTASQPGNATYLAALPITIQFTIDGLPQTIDFQTVTPPTVGNTTTLVATASSSLPVSFTASPAMVCTVSGDTLDAVATGTCTVTAMQAGDATYAAAPSVPQTFSISNSGQPQAVIFSSGFTNTMTTLLGGALIDYAGSNLDGWNCTNTPNVSQCGAGSGAGSSPATSYAYSYYQTYAPITVGEYEGMSVYAPGVTGMSTTANTSGVTLNGQTTISFTLNTNPEWVTATGTPNVMLELTMGDLYNSGGACNLQMQTVFAATGGATPTVYTIPLSNFNLTQNCGNAGNTAATALAQPISRLDFQGDGGTAAITINGVTSNSNLNVASAGSNPAVYPTTVALTGAITFQ